MPKKTIYIFFPLIIFFFVFTSCSKLIYKNIAPALDDGEYDSDFGYDNFSARIEEIGNSVKLLNTIVFYESYIINSDLRVTLADIKNESLRDIAVKAGGFDRTSSGTATVVYSEENRVALLTPAHIVAFPDTIVTYRLDDKGDFTQYLQSVSYIVRQSFYIPGIPEGGRVEVLAEDKEADIAIVGKKYDFSDQKIFPVIRYPAGKARDLKWGTVVYIMGYPFNFKMVTKALVSSPNKDSHAGFLLDAVINRGFSGAVVLAIRDGLPNFEIVGMVNWTAGEKEYSLKPSSESFDYDFIPIIPYKGESFIEPKINIKYGITKAVSIESIQEFINKKRDILLKKGYNADIILKTNNADQ